MVRANVKCIHLKLCFHLIQNGEKHILLRRYTDATLCRSNFPDTKSALLIITHETFCGIFYGSRAAAEQR